MSDRKMLEGRTALVTGGTGGLGRAVVRTFLQEGAEVHVPVFDEAEVPALEAHLGDAIHAVHLHGDANLSDPASVDALFRALPPVEVVAEPGRGLRRWRSWRRRIRAPGRGCSRMNATTAFLVSRAAFPAMRKGRWGRILNVSARPALDRGAAGMSAYGAAKAAVLNLTQTLAREGAPHGITANAILPTIIDTPGNREGMPGADRSDWLDPSDIAGCSFPRLSRRGDRERAPPFPSHGRAFTAGWGDG
jgi:NAD(P)-dependent dehydrogenase (short-subunit alcohol dehydrogenase family)